MTLLKWQPFSDMIGMYDRINRLFEDEYGREGKAPILAMNTPPTDIFESEKGYVLKMELPGFSKEDVKIDFANDTITIKGERKQDQEVKKEDYHRIERSYGMFQRSFSLPRNIQIEKIDANMQDGILQIVIPKAEEALPKKINISVK